MYINPFDPWKSPLCTCPPKYSLNPYTGCGHGCVYCYASAFIKNFYNPRPKKDFLKKVKREVERLEIGAIVSLSNSSDPYQPLEKYYELTKNFLKLCLKKDLKILIITKSALVTRDVDILSKLKVCVSLTITTKRFYHLIEPGASPYEERVKALKTLFESGIPTCARIDPIIPGLNDEEVLEILEEISPFVKHITTSTYKARKNSLEKLAKLFPEFKRFWGRIYLKEGKFIKGAWYLSESRRRALLAPLFKRAKELGLSIAACREGVREFESPGRCDGSFLI